MFTNTPGGLVVDINARQRAGRAVAGLLAVDGLAHVYWATGLTWPAPDQRALSLAVIGAVVPFAPRVVLPLALVLFSATAAVLARAYGRGGRFAGLVSFAVAAGLLVRGLAGLVWALGIGNGAGPVFYWLNLLLYTPLCLGFGWSAATRLVTPRKEFLRDH
ncbi:DUF3995 domain-containing protein [Streptomyces sp. NK08204]|uniref:DUF3995 domain-containing protein n=1 Tax=Streptomyces sp. NK08204 TaxID=2873260 RepID=UPI001CEC8212|nr:DUF3995 domain-containing protein [Streptomyces sp. NK08204]